MTIANTTVCSTTYCVNGEKRVLRMFYYTPEQTKTDTAAQTKQ